MLELIIFDMDGVIVQTHQTSSYVMRGVVKDLFNLEVTEEDIKNFYGLSDYEFYSEIINRTGSDKTIENVLNEQFSRYNHKLQNEVEATIGVVELIKRLARNYKVAVCSGSTRKQIDLVIARFGLQNCVTVTVTCDDVVVGKPDPAGYKLVLDKMNRAPEQALAIEDSPAGITAAQAAGIKVIGFNNGLNQDTSFANFQASSMAEIEEIINKH